MGRQKLVLTHYPHYLIPFLIRDAVLDQEKQQHKENGKNRCQTFHRVGLIVRLLMGIDGIHHGLHHSYEYLKHLTLPSTVFPKNTRGFWIDIIPSSQPFVSSD